MMFLLLVINIIFVLTVVFNLYNKDKYDNLSHRDYEEMERQNKLLLKQNSELKKQNIKLKKMINGGK